MAPVDVPLDTRMPASLILTDATNKGQPIQANTTPQDATRSRVVV
jgi:hypothetical protein